jgi:osmotically-inducible protein OsmY
VHLNHGRSPFWRDCGRAQLGTVELSGETITNTPVGTDKRASEKVAPPHGLAGATARRFERIAPSMMAVLAGALAIAVALPASALARTSGALSEDVTALGSAVTSSAPGVPGGIGDASMLAQASGTPNATASGGIGEAPIPPDVSPSSTSASSPSTTAAGAPRKAASPASKRRRTQSKQPRKDPKWVIQSKVQLALEADPRFKNVHATITQPGVIVLEGDVFDDKAKAAAQRTATGVEGVTRVINALKTTSLQWLEVQNRVNQALQRSGYPLVNAKVIGSTAYLSGQVKTDLDKQRVVTVVRSAGPDLKIGTNLITVKP